MRYYNVGDTINTLDGVFIVSEVSEAINPITFEAEPCIKVYWHGIDRRIPNNRILD